MKKLILILTIMLSSMMIFSQEDNFIGWTDLEIVQHAKENFLDYFMIAMQQETGVYYIVDEYAENNTHSALFSIPTSTSTKDITKATDWIMSILKENDVKIKIFSNWNENKVSDGTVYKEIVYELSDYCVFLFIAINKENNHVYTNILHNAKYK